MAAKQGCQTKLRVPTDADAASATADARTHADTAIPNAGDTTSTCPDANATDDPTNRTDANSCDAASPGPTNPAAATADPPSNTTAGTTYVRVSTTDAGSNEWTRVPVDAATA